MNKLASLTIVLIVYTCSATAYTSPQTAKSELDKLKAQFLPAEFANANFTTDDVKKILREKCKKVTGGDNATVIREIEKGTGTFAACISRVVNLTEIQNEMEVARPIGELDTVFGKYCGKRAQAEKCIRNFNEKLQPCLNEEEKAHNVVMMRVAISILGFVCNKNGDQIALFIAEEGPECFEENKENIANCMNSTFANYMPKYGAVPDLMQLPQLVLGPKQCVDLQKFENCVVGHLEKCSEITPANIVESMFKYVKNETKCQPIPTRMGKNGSSTLMAATTIFSTFVVALLLKSLL